jgi:hypothetical protein
MHRGILNLIETLVYSIFFISFLFFSVDILMLPFYLGPVQFLSGRIKRSLPTLSRFWNQQGNELTSLIELEVYFWVLNFEGDTLTLHGCRSSCSTLSVWFRFSWFHWTHCWLSLTMLGFRYTWNLLLGAPTCSAWIFWRNWWNDNIDSLTVGVLIPGTYSDFHL